MKKITLSLLIILMAFAATVSFTGCSPTAGLEEITFEEIVDAKLYDSYSVTSKTISYSNGSKKSEEKSETTMTGTQVKTSIAILEGIDISFFIKMVRSFSVVS